MAYAAGCIISENDPDLLSQVITYPGKAGVLQAYFSRPKHYKNGLGAVIVVHENDGLVDDIKDIVRRFAKLGFIALAPDFLSQFGGTNQFKNREERINAVQARNRSEVLEELNQALVYLKELSFFNGKIGVVGFGWGGEQSLNFAGHSKDVNAVVSYYGQNPNPLDVVQNIACPLVVIYAEDDPDVMQGVGALRESLKRYRKTFDLNVYPECKHGFHNNTDADRHDSRAAKHAWGRTVVHFRANLRSNPEVKWP
jgi:carboxymethylenebutenolidase